MTPDEAIGLAVKLIRTEQGLSQESIGPSQSFVSDVERGKKSMTFQRLDAFARALGIQPATLVIRAALLANPSLSTKELLDILRSELENSCQDRY